MIHKVLCPYCKGTLYELVALGTQALSREKPEEPPLHPEGTAEFITCLHCGKSVLMRRTTSRDGYRGFKVAEIE